MVLAQDLEIIKTLLTVKEVSAFAVLLMFIVYLWYENKQLKSRIEKAIERHQNDMKESNKDIIGIMEKWHQLTDEIKEIIRSL